MKNMNKIIVATHQPNYIPWLGYFYKISQSDTFVFLDDVQFSKTGSHNYHRIKSPAGLLKLKIPVKHKFNDPINKVITNDDGGWKERHLSAIRDNYKNAPFFKKIFPDFEILLSKKYDSLALLNIALIEFFLEKFSIKTTTVKSSSLNLKDVKNEERIIEICSQLKASVYYSGRGAMAYQNEDSFNSKGIELIYDNYKIIQYTQLWGEFQENVSVIDYIMNYGYDWDYIIGKINQ